MNSTVSILEKLLWPGLIGLLIFYAFSKWFLFKRMPPGPYGWPIIGTMFHLQKFRLVDEFKKYKAKYGDIFSLSVGNYYVIVLNDYKLIKEAAKMDEFQGRPNFNLWRLRNFGVKNRGVAFCDGGPIWQEQRKFTTRTLKDFAFGKQSIEVLLKESFDDLSEGLCQSMGKPISLAGLFNASILNSLYCVITGNRFELDDPQFKDVIKVMIENVQGIPVTEAAFFWPIRYIKYKFIKPKRSVVPVGSKKRPKVTTLMEEEVQEHFETYDENVTRDFIDSYIKHMGQSEPNSSFNSEEGKINLRVVLLDLFFAGGETTSTTLLWSIFYMTQHLEVQRKVQAELDAVVGKDRPPSIEDKHRLVYVEAVLNEVHRKCSLLSMSAFHSMLQDLEFKGFFLPKGSVVFYNQFDAHHDEKYWKDPDVFRPERFLDPSGTKLIKHDAFMPFGTGKRQCLGETLAKDMLFILFTSMLQAFNFDIDPAMTSVDQLGTSTVVSMPKPFKVVISDRFDCMFSGNM